MVKNQKVGSFLTYAKCTKEKKKERKQITDWHETLPVNKPRQNGQSTKTFKKGNHTISEKQLKQIFNLNTSYQINTTKNQNFIRLNLNLNQINKLKQNNK